ncbi:MULTISPECIES: DoxX family protein [unclassified Microbacterium]|uniref:DoxX family protein n=1 Tax=unclassified Microbacterium TaxID=2609290 RepID=UPI00342CBE09
MSKTSVARTVGRVLLGSFLLFAGVSHLTFAREEFQAQVPPWLPIDPDVTVLASGAVEVGLGGALLVMRKHRRAVGIVTALFFVAVFPGNIAQWLEHRDAFGLNTDTARFVRLFFQPVLIALALWSTWSPRARRNASS